MAEKIYKATIKIKIYPDVNNDRVYKCEKTYAVGLLVFRDISNMDLAVPAGTVH